MSDNTLDALQATLDIAKSAYSNASTNMTSAREALAAQVEAIELSEQNSRLAKFGLCDAPAPVDRDLSGLKAALQIARDAENEAFEACSRALAAVSSHVG